MIISNTRIRGITLPVLETTITQKGQVTIPVEIRRHLGLKARDRVIFELDGDVAKLRRAPSRVMRAYASLTPRSSEGLNVTREDFERWVAEEVMSEG